MPLDVDWITGVITVPKADTTLVSAGPPEIRSYDVNDFRLELRTIEATEEGQPWTHTHDHNGEVTISGVVYAHAVKVIPPYTVTWEDGQYSVRLIGNVNHNLDDVSNPNQARIVTNNSAGLIRATTDELATAVWDSPVEDHAVSGTVGDSMRRAAFLDGVVHIDTSAGVSGTTFPLGTYDAPSSNIADARAIADANSVTKYHIRGTITLDSAHANWTFLGDGGGGALVDTANFTTSAATFMGVGVTGLIKGGNMTFTDCALINVTDLGGLALRCGLSGTIALDTGQSTLHQCYSLEPGAATPVLDMVGAGRTAAIRAYSGGLSIQNMSSAGNKLTVDLLSGHVILENTITAGEVLIRGVGKLTDNSSVIPDSDDLLSGLELGSNTAVVD